MKKNRRRLLIAFLVFSLLVFMYYEFIKPNTLSEKSVVSVHEDFENIDLNMWYVGDMKTDLQIKPKLSIKDGIVELGKTDQNEDLYLLTRPLDVKQNAVIKVTRRIMINPGDGYFSGGLAIFQTSFDKKMLNLSAENRKGSAVALVEYIKTSLGKMDNKTKNGIRLRTPLWEKDKREGGSIIEKNIFGRFIDEELYYNIKTGQVKYQIDGSSRVCKSVPMTDKYVRIWMHAYGEGRNQYMKVDDVKIEFLDAEAGIFDE